MKEINKKMKAGMFSLCLRTYNEAIATLKATPRKYGF